MHFFEFTGFDPAILEKPDENLPACWTVVKWFGLPSSVNPIKIHAGAKLTLKPFSVTRKLVANRNGRRDHYRKEFLGTFVLLRGTKSSRSRDRVLSVRPLSDARDDHSSIRGRQPNFLSRRDRGLRQSGR